MESRRDTFDEPAHGKGAVGTVERSAFRETFCSSLVAARGKRGMTLTHIAEVTRIPIRSLERLERGEFEKLPADVFVRGFLRSYARCVGLDVEDTIRRYAECGMTPAPVASPMADELAESMATLESRAAPSIRARRADTSSGVSASAPGASARASSPVLSSPQILLGSEKAEAKRAEPEGSEPENQPVQSAEQAVSPADGDGERVAEPEPNRHESRSGRRRKRRRKRKQRARRQPSELSASVAAAADTAASDAGQEIDESAAQLDPEPHAASQERPDPASSDDIQETGHESLAAQGLAQGLAPGLDDLDDDDQTGDDRDNRAPSAPLDEPAAVARIRADEGSSPMPRPSLVIDDDCPEVAAQVQDSREAEEKERDDQTWRNFLPPSLLDTETGSRRGALTLAVIILVIVATLTMSYLLRRPSQTGDGVTQSSPPSLMSPDSPVPAASSLWPVAMHSAPAGDLAGRSG